MTQIFEASITAAGTQVSDWVTGFGALNSLSALCVPALSGGTSCKVYLQTSLDGGVTAIDIACWAETNGTQARGVAIGRGLGTGAGAAPLALTDGGLADNSVIQGILGDRFKVKVVSTGAYTNGSKIAVHLAGA